MKEKSTDGVVSFENARGWAEELFAADPQALILRAFAVEPAVMSAVAVAGKRCADLLEEADAPEQMQRFAVSQICLAGAIAIELMRRGNAELWQDMMGPEDTKKEQL